jgi:type III restriction enzyme
MALTLKDYQQRTLERLGKFLEAARLHGPAQAFARQVQEGLDVAYKPLPNLEAVPYVCLRIPTGGGKTVLGARLVKTVGDTYLERTHPLVLWLVPTKQIKNQTLDALRDPRHPYRQELDDAFAGRVGVFDITDIEQIRPADLSDKVCVVVATLATARVHDTELRDFYAHKEALEPHFIGLGADAPALRRTASGEIEFSFANLLALHGPLVITDEAHNATTELSFEVYQRLSPRAVIELTATPDAASSNVLVSVSAFELKAEQMIKLPVVLKEHDGDWPPVVSAAVARRRALAVAAAQATDYIRPILLIQAENARGVATVEEVKKHLVETDGVAENAIAIATGSQRELDGVDLFARACPIEVIITKQALKEGWDCSFAYVFCSVAQVHSDRDVQQLLGRVLRMPYAKARRQPDLNKAYAHVVSASFGEAAAELTRTLTEMGFNPLEAIGGVRGDSAQAPLELAGGAAASAPALPKAEIAVSAEPDFSAIPERDRARVRYTPAADGAGGTVEVNDEIDGATVAAIVKAVPRAQRKQAEGRIEQHQMQVAAAKAPSERGEVFRVPMLCRRVQGELELVDRGVPDGDFQWNLLDTPADLSSFAFNEDAMTFEVDIDGEQRAYFHQVKEDPAAYLPGFDRHDAGTDLLKFLDDRVRDRQMRQPMVREWLRRAVEALQQRGFSLAQLNQARYVLCRKLQEQLLLRKQRAAEHGFQTRLFASADIVTSLEPNHAFEYPADMSRYPAHSYCDHASYRFRRHYYPFPGDLRWHKADGTETEEYQCARALDLLDGVKFWVRNLVHPSQFWMPTAKQRTYPDFVARLDDGRLFVVEYKGGDRVSNDDSKMKRRIGELWAARSDGHGVYLMAQKRDAQGRDVREQMLAAMAGTAHR